MGILRCRRGWMGSTRDERDETPACRQRNETEMSGIEAGTSAGDKTNGLPPPVNSMEVVNSTDSGPNIVEAKEGSSSSCTATSATAVGAGTEPAAAAPSAEGDASGVVEELTKVRRWERHAIPRGEVRFIT